MTHSDYISRSEAATLLGVDRQTISNYIDKGMLSWRQIGQMKYVLRSDLEKFRANILEYKVNNDIIQTLISAQKVEMDRLKAQLKSKRTAMEDAGYMLDIFLDLVREVMLTHKGCLNDREQRLVDIICKDRAHFGINFQEVAEDFFLSRERVRQITNTTMRKLIELIQIREDNFKTLQNRCHCLEATVEALRAINNKAATKASPSPEFRSDIFKTKLVDCGLSIRAKNCLKCADIHTVGDLVMHNKTDLLQFRNFGRKSISEIETFLDSHNLHLGMTMDEVISL